MKTSTKALGLTALLGLLGTGLVGCSSDDQATAPEAPAMEAAAETSIGAENIVEVAEEVIAEVVEVAEEIVEEVVATAAGMVNDAVSSAEDAVADKMSESMSDMMGDSAMESVEDTAKDAAAKKMSDAMSGMMGE